MGLKDQERRIRTRRGRKGGRRKGQKESSILKTFCLHRVDDVVRSMYPPLDPKLLDAR